jgi:hypothetical protein
MTTSSHSEFAGCRHGADADAGLWRLGLVTDRRGRVHLGAVVRGAETSPPTYIDLLAPVGASSAADLDLSGMVPLVRGEHLADLRRMVEGCIDHPTLKARLLALVEDAWTD